VDLPLYAGFTSLTKKEKGVKIKINPYHNSFRTLSLAVISVLSRARSMDSRKTNICDDKYNEDSIENSESDGSTDNNVAFRRRRKADYGS
jgi:hypothetical protein